MGRVARPAYRKVVTDSYSRNTNLLIKECPVCHSMFFTTYVLQITCSKECREIKAYEMQQMCFAADAKATTHYYIHHKLRIIKSYNYSCTGCGHMFADDAYALDMIFERCHVHCKRCPKRTEDNVFYACRKCNAKQLDKCGYWASPGRFIELCID